MPSKQPEWRIPANLQALIDADDDLTWETDDWLPIQLTVMGGTSYNDRDIKQAWQLEYEPTGCSGYDFLARIEHAVTQNAPEIAQ